MLPKITNFLFIQSKGYQELNFFSKPMQWQQKRFKKLETYIWFRFLCHLIEPELSQFKNLSKVWGTPLKRRVPPFVVVIKKQTPSDAILSQKAFFCVKNLDKNSFHLTKRIIY